MSIVQKVIGEKYNRMLLQDFLRARIRDAGFDAAEITKTPVGTRVMLRVTKPGIVIGRKGSTIRELTESLETDYGMDKPQVSVEEIDKPELSPSVMCSRMASHLDRGIAFRRATMWSMQQVMEAGARGVQITISGKLRGDRSAFEKHTAGILPRAGDHADKIVRDDTIDVKTPMGLIGIRIRIALADRYVPEFDMKDPREVARRERERERRRRDREERAREEREARERHREQSSRVRGAGAGTQGGGDRRRGRGRGAGGRGGSGADKGSGGSGKGSGGSGADKGGSGGSGTGKGGSGKGSGGSGNGTDKGGSGSGGAGKGGSGGAGKGSGGSGSGKGGSHGGKGAGAAGAPAGEAGAG